MRPGTSRSARSAWNFATSLGMTAVSLVAGFIAAPWLLRWLGQERLGAFRALSDWSGYFVLFEFGLAGALMPLLAQASVQRQESRLADVMIAGFSAYRRAAVAMLLAGIVIALAIPWLVPVSGAIRPDLQAAAFVVLLTIIFVPLTPLRPLCDAEQRGYIVNAMAIVQSLSVVTLSVLFAWRRAGITGQTIAIVVGSMVFYLVLLAATWKRHRFVMQWIAPRPVDPDARAAIAKLNWPNFVLNICGRVGLLTDNIIIAGFISPAAVVPFFFTQRLAQIAQAQVQAIGNASWAGLAHLHASGAVESFQKTLLELTRLVVIAAMALLVPIYVFNRAFVTRWLGAEQFAGEWLTALACLNGVCQAITSLWGWVFSGTGQIARLLKVQIAMATLNISISVGATWILRSTAPQYAILGPLVGTTLAFVLLASWWMPLLLRQTFAISRRSIAGAIAPPLAIGVGYAAMLRWLISHVVVRGWIPILAGMALSSALFMLFAWFLLLSKDQRAVWRIRLRLATGMRGVAP